MKRVYQVVTHTKSDAEERPGRHRVILELVMKEAKNRNEEVEDDPNGKEHLSTTFVNKPKIDLLTSSHRRQRGLLGAPTGIHTLQALQLPSLRFHTLKMTVLYISISGPTTHVGMLLQAVGPVREIEARRTITVCHFRYALRKG